MTVPSDNRMFLHANSVSDVNSNWKQTPCRQPPAHKELCRFGSTGFDIRCLPPGVQEQLVKVAELRNRHVLDLTPPADGTCQSQGSRRVLNAYPLSVERSLLRGTQGPIRTRPLST